MLILEHKEHNHLEVHSHHMIHPEEETKEVTELKDHPTNGDQIMLTKEKGSSAKTKTIIETKMLENYRDSTLPK